MRFYEASSTIQARPEAIWAVLTDAPAYSQWDSGVVALEGRIGPGEKLKVTSEVNPKRAYPVKITEFEPGRRMAWTGGIPLGLMKGVRAFTLAPDGGATKFTVREELSGPMLPLIWRTMPDMQPSFEKFAAGLKKRAEG
jgi:hypothetical protein